MSRAPIKLVSLLLVIITLSGCPRTISLHLYNASGGAVEIFSKKINLQVDPGQSIEIPYYGNDLDRSATGEKVLRIRSRTGDLCRVVAFSRIGVPDHFLGEGRKRVAKLMLDSSGDIYVIPRFESADNYMADLGKLRTMPKLSSCG